MLNMVELIAWLLWLQECWYSLYACCVFGALVIQM